MGNDIATAATRFRARAGISGGFDPLMAARAAGFFLVPTRGTVGLADGFVLRYDESQTGWDRAVASLACGRILRSAGIADSSTNRATLAALLGIVA